MSAVAGAGNAEVIGVLMAELDALGVVEFCVCAGARNVALIEALAAEGPRMVLHHFFEERSAAFFALGRVINSRKPVAVVTTSGTAVAELFPAVMEAHYQALPLVVVTADRPSRYRGSGAPQAVEQRGIFTRYVVRDIEIEHEHGTGLCIFDGADEEAGAGPLHFNVCLEEGLGTRERAPVRSVLSLKEADVVNELHRHDWRQFWDAGGDLVVLASGIHPDDVPSAREFLLKLSAPVLAEATSNLLVEESLQPFLLHGGEQALKQLDAKRVVRLGSVPSWRWWRDLDARGEVPVLNISRAGFRGLARTHQVFTVPWEMLRMEDARRAEDRRPPPAAMQERLQRLLDTHPHSEPAWMRHLSRVIGAGATVFLGNSLPIREWNLAADRPEPGSNFFANRGTNGIDGLISTWLGVGAEARESWLILGDLSALYDMSAPWILPQLRAAKRRIVVINNGGGQIFSRVAWLKDADAVTRRIMENPHSLSFEPWARMWGMDYRLLTDAAACLDDAAEGCAVWEVRPDAAETGAFWKEWQR